MDPTKRETQPLAPPPARAERLLGLLTEGRPDSALLLLEPNGHVLACSAGAERLLGYRQEDLRGEHFCRLFFRSEEVRRGEPEYELHAARAEGYAASARWYSRKDGTVLWGVGVTMAVADLSGQVRAFVTLLRDLTAQRLRGAPSGDAAGSLGDSFDGLRRAVRGCGELFPADPGPVESAGELPAPSPEAAEGSLPGLAAPRPGAPMKVRGEPSP